MTRLDQRRRRWVWPSLRDRWDVMIDEMKIFGGSANPVLTRKICEYLGMPVGRGAVVAFPDGELMVKLEEDVRGRDVFVVQPTCHPVNQNIMELLIWLDCLKRASALRVTAVLPYFGYARQDRKDEGRVPITAKLMANLITTAGADRVLTLDLHAAQIQGFFDIPVDHLTAEPVLSTYFANRGLKDLVLVSPDVGNAKQARVYAQRLGGELAIVDKVRLAADKTVAGAIIGDVKGKTVLMMDDMITTAGTMVEGAKLVREHGAKRVLVGATHPVLCGPAVERLAQGYVDEIVVTDTIPVNGKAAEVLGDRLKVLSVSELLGEAIRRIHHNESVSSLFLK
ncbi:MAG: Ribose-phosphate pyrophosphokinase [Phycisphaerae bacterium]|nr:Ribose-phosphate pyrophosphokinase [Phycisphaerae bacterium]